MDHMSIQIWEVNSWLQTTESSLKRLKKLHPGHMKLVWQKQSTESQIFNMYQNPLVENLLKRLPSPTLEVQISRSEICPENLHF